eukprot:Clim_evm31s109 gene=Clim_evmTU31s109
MEPREMEESRTVRALKLVHHSKTVAEAIQKRLRTLDVWLSRDSNTGQDLDVSDGSKLGSGNIEEYCMAIEEGLLTLLAGLESMANELFASNRDLQNVRGKLASLRQQCRLRDKEYQNGMTNMRLHYQEQVTKARESLLSSAEDFCLRELRNMKAAKRTPEAEEMHRTIRTSREAAALLKELQLVLKSTTDDKTRLQWEADILAEEIENLRSQLDDKQAYIELLESDIAVLREELRVS